MVGVVDSTMRTIGRYITDTGDLDLYVKPAVFRAFDAAGATLGEFASSGLAMAAIRRAADLEPPLPVPAVTAPPPPAKRPDSPALVAARARVAKAEEQLAAAKVTLSKHLNALASGYVSDARREVSAAKAALSKLKIEGVANG